MKYEEKKEESEWFAYTGLVIVSRLARELWIENGFYSWIWGCYLFLKEGDEGVSGKCLFYFFKAVNDVSYAYKMWWNRWCDSI